MAGGKAQEVALLGASISHSPCSASCAVLVAPRPGRSASSLPIALQPDSPIPSQQFSIIKHHLALSGLRPFAQALASVQNVFSLPSFFLLYLVLLFHIPSLILNAPSQP